VKTPDHFWTKIPRSSLAVFLLGVFFIFGTLGSAVDTMGLGRQSTARYLVSVVLFGVFAIFYATSGFLLRGRSLKLILPMVLVEMVVIGHVLRAIPAPHQMGPADINHLQSRLTLDAGMTIGGMVLAYICFIYVFISEGRRYFGVHAEMELASDIHRVLVPQIETTIGSFEFYGRSLPSGQVGGDLIDVVQSSDRWIAYIADVSGHGVAPGVLMGMVKSAARMYLSSNEGSEHFLERLNSVLNPIRKPEMFVTMAFIAWEGDRLAFSTAGHPPILHYCRANKTITERACNNLPVGLFTPQEFVGDIFSAQAGDVFLLLTDGLLEVTNQSGAEFAVEGLKKVLLSAADKPLSTLADHIFEAAKAFGRTSDDESLLLIRS
jgi:Stage II sporulation protein E (SpoIIE)